MDQFTPEETERLNKILSDELNPFLNGEAGGFSVQLGKTTQEWLFRTHMNLPPRAKDELQNVLSENVANSVRVRELSEYLDRNQVYSAPQWWELEFFDFNRHELWQFIVQQCRNNFDHESLREYFDILIERAVELNWALRVVRAAKLNSTHFSQEEVAKAFKIVDQSYPLDFVDYEEVPKKSRSPYDLLQELIAHKLSDLESVFSKQWFEFKILDELSAFESFVQDGQRDSPLSKQLAGQIRMYMFGRAMGLGRMVEHYRWKFSYEAAALKGIRSAKANYLRGKKGADASGRAKKENLDCLMQELEALADVYPQMSEEAIFKQAYANASAVRRMPKSQKTKDTYGIIIRSEEQYKSRYDAIFRKKA
ncbi:hypothetical protein [Palleronia sp. LCG004]|uniref:hypothetical protein n=1 Tax=Palleronia sp. LCG004 TaxID=3079304 RepID=UPI0029420C23|nr:hypothetical protein [Palleronia sp. LCG004]WOI55592.1 hypothetical protein RVY76_11140 [Palleronia sp. LCG004]